MEGISLEEAVRSRRSVRGFLPRQVPQPVLDRIFDLARWSPSGTNLQPWHTCVASGTVRDKLRARMMENVQTGIPANTDHPSDGRLQEVFKERRRGCARVLYDSMGIDWDDKAGRGHAAFRNFELFDAPHVAFLCIHEAFGVQSACDVGMYAQTLMLAMTANGVASCAQGTMRNYPDLVRETFGLAPEIKVLFGISFGYEDRTHPTSNAKTTRAPVEENVVFLG